MAIDEIEATARPRAGKGAARAVRRAGRIPAVIYGDKKEPETIAIDHPTLVKLLNQGGFLSNVFNIKIEGRSNRVLPRDIQFDPVKDLPIHVDFQRVSGDGAVRVAVPVVFLNEETSPGLKRGGVLNIVRHEVEVNCPADAIPAQIEVDLAEAEIGDSIHISAVKLPDGVVPTITDRDFTVVTVAGSASARSEADEDGAEPTEEGAEEAATESDSEENKDE
ncbi:MAG: 50S ribosomal protein L25/general stress protein Ctc [Alphaproteobacteria bacterium]|nr:50S ribosomal protein L25/general stress protein Ctc [Alphaproteobacteria bacterium]